MNDWSDFEKYVFNELKEIKKEIAIVNVQVGGLKTKVASIASVITAVCMISWDYIKRKLHL